MLKVTKKVVSLAHKKKQMELKGKRVERLNRFGDALILRIGDDGVMRLSPALMSRLKLVQNDNRIGFGYPENENEAVVIYKAIDGDGVAVNKQGYIKNIPHNRDLRSHLNLAVDTEIEVNISELTVEFDDYPGMVFHKISRDAHSSEISKEARAQNTIDDLYQAIEKSGGEVITEETISDEEIEEIDEISSSPSTTEETKEVEDTEEKKIDQMKTRDNQDDTWF